jgi:hypothetical protein
LSRDASKSKARTHVNKWAVALGAIIALIALGIAMGVANWLFSVKIEGAWLSNKAALNVWDLWFQRGVYWTAVEVYVLAFALIGLVFAVGWRHLGRGAKGKDEGDRSWMDTRARLAKSFWPYALPVAILGGLAVALFFGHEAAQRALVVETYLKSNGLSWVSFATGNYWHAATYILSGHYPTGSYLVSNTSVFDFISAVNAFAAPILVLLSLFVVMSMFLHGDGITALRDFAYLMTLWYLYLGVFSAPAVLADVSLPMFSFWRVTTAVILTLLSVSLTFGGRLWRKMLPQGQRRTLIRAIVVGLLIILTISAPTIQSSLAYHVFQNYPANQNSFEFPYTVSPHISYVQWADQVDKVVTANSSALAVPPGGEEQILQSIRVVSYSAATSQMQYAYGRNIGQPWMELSPVGPMIVWSNNREYWLLPTSPVLPEQSTQEVGAKYQYTHSEVILAVDAANGTVVPVSSIWPQVDQSKLAMYYGIGGLFHDQDTVYLHIGNWTETHLAAFKGSAYYDGAPDYVFGGNATVLGASERFWYFLLAQGNWQFATGGAGQNVAVLTHRDVTDRVSSLLVDGLVTESDPTGGNQIPYFVVDPQGNVYYAFLVNIDRPLTSPYADTALGQFVNTSGDFRRSFAVVLINARDGTVHGYRNGDWNENYITQYYSSFYPAWNNPAPSWLEPQVRYSKSLMYQYVDLYNTYHIPPTDASSWYKTLNMYDFPLGRGGYFSNTVDDIRYVPMYYNGQLTYAAVRLIEVYKQQSGTWTPRSVAGMFVFFGNGQELFVPLNQALPVQLILDSVTSQQQVQNILTTRKLSGQDWQQGNLLMYIIGNRPVYFLPYYIPTPSLLNVGMVIAVDGVTGKVSAPYVLQDSKDPAEIAAAPLQAYSLLMSGTALSSEQQRIDTIKNEITQSGFQVLTPIGPPNANVAYQYANVTLSTTQDWITVNATIHSFLNDVATGNGTQVVNMWTNFTGTNRTIYIGVLVQTKQGIELHLLTITFTAG